MDRKVVAIGTEKSYVKNIRYKVKSILCYAFSFLLSLALVGLAFLFVIEWSCFDKSVIFHDLAASKYYDNVKDSLYSKAETITLPTGLSLKVLDNIIVYDELQKDINGYVTASLRKSKYQPDTSELKNRLRQNIASYLKEHEIEPDQEQRKNINAFLDSISDEYSNFIQIPMFNHLVSVKENYRKIYYTGIILCSIIIVVALGFLLRMNGWLHRALNYVTYATLAAALMLTTAPAAILITGIYRRLTLSPRYFYDFSVIYIMKIIQTLLFTGLYYATVSIILMVMIKTLKSRVMKRYKI